jgi:calcium-dependent protein kinase
LQDHGALPERAVALIAYEVLQVVEKCHELGILHGDLKPANFVLADRTQNPLFSNDINLLFGKPWLLAIDFGCSQYLTHVRFSKRTGTPGEQQGQGICYQHAL